jgi:hypothetical protein
MTPIYTADLSNIYADDNSLTDFVDANGVPDFTVGATAPAPIPATPTPTKPGKGRGRVK